jgi:epoxyqueuosine reductase
MDQNELKLELKTEADRLGFSLFGVTTSEPPEHLSIFQSWLQSGFYGGMDYLIRKDTLQKRADPRLLLPGCRSIICLGFPYSLDKTEKDFYIASFARMEDYHTLLPRLLSQLLKLLAQHSTSLDRTSIFSDSAPILERELAARAGLGWIGKNSCLISPSAGSAFLMAEIFTTLELKPDPPFTSDHCGNCTRCIQNCPTNCILPNRTIDAERCISYLTIENSGTVNEDYRELIGDKVFGCDICQEVCPWNKKRLMFNIPAPEIIDAGGFSLLAQMTDREFKIRFASSPLLRSGRLGLLRNGVIAMGNSLDMVYLPVLKEIESLEKNPTILDLTEWAKENIRSTHESE